jgi:hypothetical protein
MQPCTNIVHTFATYPSKYVVEISISEKYGIPTIDVRKVLQDEIAKASESKRPPGSGKPGSRRSNAWSERQRSMHEAMKKLEKGELVKDDVLNTSVLMRLLDNNVAAIGVSVPVLVQTHLIPLLHPQIAL